VKKVLVACMLAQREGVPPQARSRPARLPAQARARGGRVEQRPRRRVVCVDRARDGRARSRRRGHVEARRDIGAGGDLGAAGGAVGAVAGGAGRGREEREGRVRCGWFRVAFCSAAAKARRPPTHPSMTKTPLTSWCIRARSRRRARPQNMCWRGTLWPWCRRRRTRP
jgi:hypothetical protein